MSKGQKQQSRQPVARVRGREASQGRKPATDPRAAATGFIKNKPAQLPPGAGKTLARKPAGKPFNPAVTSQSNSPETGTPRRPPRATAEPGQLRTDKRASAWGQPGGAAGSPDAQRARPARDTSASQGRARKMAVRDPGQQVLDRSRRLRETRVSTDRIEPVRLQKALSQSGVGSRREMEAWIEAGFVLVNGRRATLGDKVGPQDRVSVKGDPIKLKWADRLPRVILYHKQEGEIVSRDDPGGRISIFDRLPQAKSSRWVAVGRLDVNTSGLMIITTSGELANCLMHPSFEVEREYAVRVLGELTDEQRREMCQEIMLDDGPAHFERIIDQGGEGVNHWYRVILREGRNREVRRLFEHFGLQVSRLMRVRFGQIALPPRLKRGQFYELNEVEVAAVMKWSHLTITGSKR